MSGSSREALLGALGEHVISVFPTLQREVTLPHDGLTHITPAEADVLREVLLEPGSSVTQIARAIGQQRSNTSTRIANLVDGGLVEKRVEGGDGREVRVYATEYASRNLDGFRGVWGRVLADVSTASEADLEIAARVLGEMSEGLAQWRSGFLD
ncbi:MAG: MarR family winged helix-turn-helix transcriptional regulator [Pseudoclavibacter sp.]